MLIIQRNDHHRKLYPQTPQCMSYNQPLGTTGTVQNELGQFTTNRLTPVAKEAQTIRRVSAHNDMLDSRTLYSSSSLRSRVSSMCRAIAPNNSSRSQD